MQLVMHYWSGLPCPPPRDLPNPGIEPRSLALQADSLPSEPPRKPSVQFNSVAQSCPNLCYPMDCSTLVHQQVLEFNQTHVHWVGDAIQLILCCPLLFLPSIFASTKVFSNKSALHIRWPKYWSLSFNISPSMNIQDWSPLGWTGWISLQSKGFSRVFSNTTVPKHQFFGAKLSL